MFSTVSFVPKEELVLEIYVLQIIPVLQDLDLLPLTDFKIHFD
jgi:hypothetical protein